MLPPEKLINLLQYEGLLEELERKTDFESRIKITLLAIESCLPLKIKIEGKNSEASKNFKLQADLLVRKEPGVYPTMLEALKLYTKSIALAEKSSLRMALAYANRSSAFYQLDKMEECISDVEQALKLPYPDDRRYNLIRRKAKCLNRIDKLDLSEICDEARESIEKMTISDEKKEILEEKIIHATKSHKYTHRLKEEPNINLPEFIPHKNIPSASSAVSIAYSQNFGKHLVTNRNINAGEILIVEKPYSAILSPDRYYTNCSHCLVRTWTSIPCETCIYTTYCSEKCRSEAWQEYHDIECPLKGYMMSLNMTDLVSLSLKLVILAVRESGSIKKLKEELKEIDNCNDYIMKSLSKDGVYHSNKYPAIYNLVSHEKDRTQNEILATSLNAAMVLYYMFTATSFFGKTLDKSVKALINNDEAIFIGKLLALNIMIVQMNEFPFFEVQPDDNHDVTGFIICPVASLLNYSCHPNVSRCSVFRNGTAKQVIYALHPIEQGCQLVDDFNNDFGFTTKEKREQFMERYFFKCSCIACQESWPLVEDLPSILRIVNEKDPKVEVARAIIRSYGHERSVFKLRLKKYPGDKAKILQSLADSVKILYESTKKPSKEYFTLLKLYREVFSFIHSYRREY